MSNEHETPSESDADASEQNGFSKSVADKTARAGGDNPDRAKVQTSFELTDSFDVAGAASLREAAMAWLNQLPNAQDCRIIIPDFDNALTLQIAAALHRSAVGRGHKMRLEDPSGNEINGLTLANHRGDAA